MLWSPVVPWSLMWVMLNVEVRLCEIVYQTYFNWRHKFYIRIMCVQTPPPRCDSCLLLDTRPCSSRVTIQHNVMFGETLHMLTSAHFTWEWVQQQMLNHDRCYISWSCHTHAITHSKLMLQSFSSFEKLNFDYNATAQACVGHVNVVKSPYSTTKRWYFGLHS